jgi:hypothetical protein
VTQIQQQQQLGKTLWNIADDLRVCLNFYHLAPSGKFNFSHRSIFRRTASSYA